MLNIICPVCQTPKGLKDSIVCDNCGWLHVLYLSEMPNEVKVYLNKKKEIKLQQTKEINDLKNRNERLKSNSKEMLSIVTEKESVLAHILSSTKAIQEKVKVHRQDEIFRFNKEPLENEIAMHQANILEVKKLLEKTDYRHSEPRIVIGYRLAGNSVVIDIPVAERRFTIPSIVVGFSIKRKIHLIHEADIVFRIEKQEVNSLNKHEYTFDLPFSGLQYTSFVISLFKESDTSQYILNNTTV